MMATTTKNNVIIAEILVDAVKGGFVGMEVFGGTGAAILKIGMTAGRGSAGQSIKIPYFDDIGDAEELINDGDALTPALLSETEEVSTVRHFGKAVEVTRWAQSGVGNPYDEAKGQLLDVFKRRIDLSLIEAAKDATGWTSFINDVSGTGAGLITPDAIIDTLSVFGDESDNLAALAVHSKVFADIVKMKDASGRPIVDISLAVPRYTPLNIPIVKSDRLTATATVYPSLLLRKGALVAWINENVSIKEDSDILTDSDVLAVHLYGATHRYLRMGGKTKPGVAILKTKAST
jgi:hypothetical protein